MAQLAHLPGRNVFVRGKKRVMRGMAVALGLALTITAFQPAALVSAHQSPLGCTGNRYDVSIVKDKTQVQQGDTLTYTVTASNLNGSPDIACDITNASITVTLPAADGTPTGQVVTLEASRDFPSNEPIALIGTAQYVVNVNAGVTDIVAEVRSPGTLHDAPVDHAALIVKTIGTSVVPTPAAPSGSGSGSGSASGSASAAGNTPSLPNTGTAPRP